jgi:hypothetical protein
MQKDAGTLNSCFYESCHRQKTSLILSCSNKGIAEW